MNLAKALDEVQTLFAFSVPDNGVWQKKAEFWQGDKRLSYQQLKRVHRKQYLQEYSIVKDLGVNFKIVQNRPTVKAVCTKISKKIFCIFVNIFVFLRENKEVSFFIFWIFKLNQNYYWLWVYFGLSVSNGQIRITVLNYTVPLRHLQICFIYRISPFCIELIF